MTKSTWEPRESAETAEVPDRQPRTTRVADVFEVLRGPLAKAGLIGVVILLLLIPLALVERVIVERERRSQAVADELGAIWGGRQQIRGPLLAVPVAYPDRNLAAESSGAQPILYLLPDDYRISGSMRTERRRRGLFETPVYQADLKIEGTFAHPLSDSAGPGSGRLLWDRARLVFGAADPRNIGGAIALTWNGRPLVVEPGVPADLAKGLGHSLLRSRLSAPLPRPQGSAGAPPGLAAPGLEPDRPEPEGGAFTLSLMLNGSQGLDFLPLGRKTDVSLTSTWPSPSFEGAYLPQRHELGADGFAADWAISYFGRSFPQQWTNGDELGSKLLDWDNSAFGVRLFQPVDSYHQAERSVKYGVLFLVYTFGALFLFERLGGLCLHIVHYGLVGLSLSLFFLLLLALAEHLGFGPAYGIAAAAVVVQIGAYSWRAIGAGQRAAAFVALLAGLYAALYGLLQLETFALLIGSVFLFLLLALVMAAARRIDWYARESV